VREGVGGGGREGEGEKVRKGGRRGEGTGGEGRETEKVRERWSSDGEGGRILRKKVKKGASGRK